jgi:hypothetical protein
MEEHLSTILLDKHSAKIRELFCSAIFDNNSLSFLFNHMIKHLG